MAGINRAQLSRLFLEKQVEIAVEIGTFRKLAEQFQLGEYSEEGFMMSLMMILMEEAE